jgi:quinol monooxygenase YgiN
MEKNMITINANWTILEGKRDQAIPALQELEKAVREQEPFVLMYTIHVPNLKLTSYPTPAASGVFFFSIFTNYAAFEKHLNGPVFQDWLKKYQDLFLLNNGNLFVTSEWLDRIAGYIRPELLMPEFTHA